MINIQRIGVVGAGSMGAGIAHLAAQSGFAVTLTDASAQALEKASQRILSVMDRAVSKGKLTEVQKEEIFSRITMTGDLEQIAEADFVIEAVFEDLSVKQEIFRKLDTLCREDVILTTNTSSISITAIASATNRTNRVAGMHFFNPPQVMRLVEIVRGYETTDETVSTVRTVAEKMGKTPVVVERDTPGFIVNRILIAQFIEAIRLVEEGVASKEDVDLAVKLGLNYPMGPFELQDFAGVEIGLYVMDVLFNEFKDPRYAAPQMLRQLVRAGRLGRKVNKGWYDYEEGNAR
ncbi:MAG: 3-hydroxyacyl-CoA dehydrogenase family protein [Alicyclobacillaceae bacterium]|nr:3-hydroxyacyl-CoA dehydrogenase family protein [Alicyclobacillaceae bacterium]